MRSEAQVVLRDDIEADPEPRRQLETHLSTSLLSSAHTSHSVVITGSRLSHSHASRSAR